jgi:hypothetical protein
MDTAINLYHKYYDKVMTWYDALPFLEQMGVLFVAFVVAFGFVAWLLLRRAAG